MERIYIFLQAIIIVIIFGACEKVIDVPLEESDKQIVIEAKLHEGIQNFRVDISKTAPYFEDIMPEKIENAVVTLSDDKNNSFNIPHSTNGEYSAQITGETNLTYTLKVEIDSTQYSATSYLPEKIYIDKIYSEYEKGFGPRESGYTVYFRYSNPANIPDYYRVVYSLNGEKQNSGEDMQVFNDKLNDGNSVEMPLIMKVFQPNDIVNVELIHFDKASYDYFFTLATITGGMQHGGGTAAPANPTTNWSGGVLGYFSAYSSDSLSVTIK